MCREARLISSERVVRVSSPQLSGVPQDKLKKKETKFHRHIKLSAIIVSGTEKTASMKRICHKLGVT